MEVERLFREVADPAAAALLDAPAAGFTELEPLPLLQPATATARAVTPAAPRPSFRTPNPDIVHPTSRWKHPDEVPLCN
jgi:hypothetical protein